jgi:hypothetical protein
VAARVTVPLVGRAAALVVERLRRLIVIALAGARRWAGLVVALRPVPISALPVVGLVLAVTRGAASAGSAVLAVLVLLILARSAVAVALSALVLVGLSVIGLVRPLRA